MLLCVNSSALKFIYTDGTRLADAAPSKFPSPERRWEKREHIFVIFSHSWIDWPELKGEKDPGWYLFTGAITNLTNMMEKMKQTMFLLFFNEWMNEGSLPKRGCKNGFAGYAKSWYLFCQCLLQCSIIALMPFVFFPPLTPSERLIICWWSLCFVLLQQHDWGWWDVYQEVL